MSAEQPEQHHQRPAPQPRFQTGVGTLTATAATQVAAGHRYRLVVDDQLLEVAGGGNAALVNLHGRWSEPDAEQLYGYGATYFGNCCRRSYDVRYNTNAPFSFADAGRRRADP